MARLATVVKSKTFLAIAGVLVGALTILGIRFFTYEPQGTHYHANFAVYINGEREKFAEQKYYEETAGNGCSINPVADPVERAHMHDEVFDVVHVHDDLVTWGNLFENIKWGLGDTYLQTDKALYQADNDNKLTFIVNGKEVKTINRTIIGDEDRLLISYGKSSQSELKEQFDSIAQTAHQVDVTKDPATCSAGSKVVTWQDRFDHLF